MAAPAVEALPRPLTYDDLRQTPDDGNRYELIGGELIVTAAPSPRHQAIIARLVGSFADFVRPRKLGKVYAAPIDVKLTEHNTVEPALVYVSRARRAIVREDNILGAPDLVLEVRSPSTRHRDLVSKAALYADFGVPEYWLVAPQRQTVTVLTLRDGRYHPLPAEEGQGSSRVLPGFTLDVAALFQDLW